MANDSAPGTTVTAFHCPVCPLVFQFRPEVEWHLQYEHRTRADADVNLRIELSAAGCDLDRDRLRALQSSHASPSISLLMATVPGPTMSGLDIARLRHLTHLAQRRLAAEPGAAGFPAVEQRLASAAAAVEGIPTNRGVAILVSAYQVATFVLPFAPRDRVVVDPRFATRDLEFALQYHPRFRLLVLGPSPRILEGSVHHLVDTLRTPVAAGAPLFGGAERGLGRRSVRPEHWLVRRARQASGCAEADRLLDERTQIAGEMPLIVAGDNRWRSEFRQRSRHTASVIAEIRGSRSRAPAARLAELAGPGLDAWRRTEQARRVAELQQADANGEIVWGLAGAWRAVRDAAADHIWVAPGYSQPGRHVSGVNGIETTRDAAEPGVSDDLVDDLMQMAAAHGITVDLVPDSALSRLIGLSGLIGLDRPEPIAARIPARSRREHAIDPYDAATTPAQPMMR
jgi:hypothetical protein